MARTLAGAGRHDTSQPGRCRYDRTDYLEPANRQSQALRPECPDTQCEADRAYRSRIKAFGFNNAVLIDKNNGIIAGHGRVEAAKQLGFETVPCVRLEHLSDAQKRAYIGSALRKRKLVAAALDPNRVRSLGGCRLQIEPRHATNQQAECATKHNRAATPSARWSRIRVAGQIP